MTELQIKLRDNPFFWSRLGFCYDPPRAGADGKQIIFSREFDEYNRVHRAFADAGVKFHTTILHSGWVADNTYDYTLTDETLDAIFKGNPDIFYMPRVKLNVPPDWCRNHPEDTFVYFNGPRGRDEIAALAMTDRHDYFGFESNGYSVNGGKGVWKDDRQNRGGLIGLQSFSSEKWVSDASEALRRLLEHLAGTKYADRIIGVHIAYGMCGETSLWGAWSPLGDGRRGDFGITNRRRFAEYGIEKYGSRAEAEENWGNLEPPAPLEREGIRENLSDMFFPEGSKKRDYFEFSSSVNADAINAYCKVVKDCKLFGRELAAGAFYGYVYLPQSAYSGHLAVQKLLDSPYVDFMSSPKGYFRCLCGDPGGEQGPSESIALKKVWLDEIDNHTHLDRRANLERAANAEESKTLLWREAVKNISHGQGFWWMDLGEGWYDSPELMDEIAKITKMQDKYKDVPHQSTAEILLVIDEKSIASTRVSYWLCDGLMYQLHSELKLCGAPVDTLRLSDLFSVPLGQYKMIVFANCFRLEQGERKKLLKLTAGKLVVWNYAAGILAPDYNPCNFRRLTGFELREIPRADGNFYGYSREFYKYALNSGRPFDFPLFTVESEGMEVLSRYPFGNREPMCAIARQNGGEICVCACPSLHTATLRALAKRAGVTIMCDADCAVFADNRIAGFFPKEKFKGEIIVGGEAKQAEIPAHGRLIFDIAEK